MSTVNRRSFIKVAASAFAGSAVLSATRSATAGAGRPRVVIVGGGFAGATMAKYLKIGDPSLSVMLVEPKKNYVTCPESSQVIAGLKPMSAITFSYDALKTIYGVMVIHDRVVAVEPDRRAIRLSGGDTLNYQQLVISPGIGFLWDAVAGYGPAVAKRIPHAWNAGRQTEILRNQLATMSDGGVVILSPPPGIYRCGPAPYERASFIAYFLKTHKPKSKLLILDPKDEFPQKEKFQSAWATEYPNLIDWIPLSEDGKIVRIDANAMTVETEFGERHKAHVINFIPAQRAGDIAVAAGLADKTGWCPIDPVTSKSRLAPTVQILGDSIQGSPLPKAASAAHSQAKIAALFLISQLNDKSPPSALYDSRCFSLAAPDHGMTIGGRYGVEDGEFVAMHQRAKDAARLKSPQILAEEARDWFRRITSDTFT